ncbi:probable rRNA-processing protein EBP2 [Dendronephthya gigantea]|uniref:probable rRNA-processing protein EBP2 n=1 Tax=Dendronephthya gigantea TaxID=151771 RepID=UPI0010690DDD|nr:probable rRNA-processing protein EBP2 [Dendronephthya gigantea]
MASENDENLLLEDSFSEQSDGVSDEELQNAFLSGKVKPGLNRMVEKVEKVFVNKVPELNEKLNEIKLELDWLERLDVTSDIGKDDTKNEMEKTDVHDDFKREMKFYKQAQMAVSEALPKLKKLGVPINRPSDYFAEMVKTDDHMQKVREKLVTKELAMEKSEKARKLRAMKKYGKKVQQEVLKKRQQEKKQMLESVKKYRKGQKGKPEFLQDNDDEFDINTDKGTKRSAPNKPQEGKSAKRQRKDSKYGFGGKKRAKKRNTADSVADVSAFSSAKHSKAPRAKTKTKAKRVGKARRQKLKSKGR